MNPAALLLSCAFVIGLAACTPAGPGPVVLPQQPLPHSPPSLADRLPPSSTGRTPAGTPPSAPSDTIASSAPHGEAVLATLASPIPRGRGPCPPPGAGTRSVFANALRLANESDAVEPHHAIAEAIRMRLDELFQSGCQPSLTDEQLHEELLCGVEAKVPPDVFVRRVNATTLIAGHDTFGGSGVALYVWDRGKVRTRIHVTNEGQAMEKQLLLLDAKAFVPEGTAEPVLVVASTHLWVSSCWRGLRFRVLAAGQDARSPRTLVDRRDSGRWCEGVSIETKGAEVTFAYNTWAKLFHETIWRPATLSFRLQSGVWEQRWGFAQGFESLVEDWLTQPWACAREATVASSHGALEPLHATLARRAAAVDERWTEGDGPSFSHELFPAGPPERRRLAVYCALRGSGKPCPEWPKPVDFVLELNDAHWRVRDVAARP